MSGDTLRWDKATKTFVSRDALEDGWAEEELIKMAESAGPGSSEEPPPKPQSTTPIWHLVIKDMLDRDQAGRDRYGTPLQAHNGRKPLIDAYQELLDLCVYLRQEMEERR